MRVVISGTRTITDYTQLEKAIKQSGFLITEVVSGHCRGVDIMGEEWAKNNGISIKIFPADWNKYGKSAGPIRNKQMAEYAEAAIILWDGNSRGTENMISLAKLNNLKVFVYGVSSY